MVEYMKHSEAAEYNQPRHLYALLFTVFSQGFYCAERVLVHPYKTNE